MLTILIIAFSATGHTQSPPSLPTITPPVFTPPVMAPPSIPIPPTSAEPSEGDLLKARWRGEEESRRIKRGLLELIYKEELKEAGITRKEFEILGSAVDSSTGHASIALMQGEEKIKQPALKIVLRMEFGLKKILERYERESKRDSSGCDKLCKAFNEGKISIIKDYVSDYGFIRAGFTGKALESRIPK